MNTTPTPIMEDFLSLRIKYFANAAEDQLIATVLYECDGKSATLTFIRENMSMSEFRDHVSEEVGAIARQCVSRKFKK